MQQKDEQKQESRENEKIEKIHERSHEHVQPDPGDAHIGSPGYPRSWR